MLLRRTLLCSVLLCQAFQTARAQAPPPQAETQSGAVIRTQTRLVIVDAVVTDKKGNYLHDLNAKDFKVWEDNKEQEIKTFSFEAGEKASSPHLTRYLVLFFDMSTMNPSDQVQARQAAAKFVDTATGPNRLMAVVNFGGSLQIAQNFTADAERLKKVVSGVKFSAVSTNDATPSNMPSLGRAAADFGVRDSILALRSLAKSLSAVEGRKTLILLTAGFPVSPEMISEITATIDACNKANVAVYPIDVRGLVAPSAFLNVPSTESPMPLARAVNFRPESLGAFQSSFFQRGTGSSGGGTTGGGGAGGSRGGGATTGGGTSSGGSRGGAGTTGGGGGRTTGGGTTGPTGNTNGNRNFSNNPLNPNNPLNQSRGLIPKLPESSTVNQNVMYMLASGTGGFVIVNTNDLVGGLEKIASEQNQYYVLGYEPAESEEGSCHVLKVKVGRGGTIVRARSGYCNVPPTDLLAGTPTEKELENRVAAAGPGNIKASMLLPYFYTAPNTARVNVAMEIPADHLTFSKEKGKFHSTVNILGVAYNADGSVGARFSDTVKLHFEKKGEVEEFQQKPMHYENQFDVASGKYILKVAFSSGGAGFGKLETPLVIDSYDSKQLALSGIALSKRARPLAQMEAGLDAALVEDRTPLVSGGMQFTPSGDNVFHKGELALFYAEVYEPLLTAEKPPTIGLQVRVLDRATGEQKNSTGFMNIGAMIKGTNPVVPLGLKVPLDGLAPGAYRLEVRAANSAGKASLIRLTDFDLAPATN